ncbi:MAG: hypothetical protein CFE24_14965 [Flavobacterium sp. BFFFF2]|nr:MAG: hypothetical protein CFE24_14965 [Flavobacterium sp. BFFFF2]
MEKHLQEIVKEISNFLDNRYELLTRNNCKNIIDYNQRIYEKIDSHEILPGLKMVLNFSATKFDLPDAELLETLDWINRINLLGRAVDIEIVIEKIGRI